jgi:hypothetical protein
MLPDRMDTLPNFADPVNRESSIEDYFDGPPDNNQLYLILERPNIPRK